MIIPTKSVLEELYLRKGLSMPKIAKRFHIHYITVRGWLLKYDIPRRKKGHRVDKWSEKEEKILVRNMGKPMDELKGLLNNRTEMAIYDHLKKLGYSRGLEKFRYKANKKIFLRKEEWSYLSGIIDGEGMITIERQKKFNSLHPKMAVTTTNTRLRDWLKQKVDSTCVISQDSRFKTKYECFIHGYSCKPVLEGIHPFLIIKGEHARLLKEFINSRLSRNSFSGFSRKEWGIYHKIRDLNSYRRDDYGKAV